MWITWVGHQMQHCLCFRNLLTVWHPWPLSTVLLKCLILDKFRSWLVTSPFCISQANTVELAKLIWWGQICCTHWWSAYRNGSVKDTCHLSYRLWLSRDVEFQQPTQQSHLMHVPQTAHAWGHTWYTACSATYRLRQSRQESLANAKVSTRQQCTYEGP